MNKIFFVWSMASNMCTLQRLQMCLRRFESVLLKWIGAQGGQQLEQAPYDGLALDFVPGTEQMTLQKSASDWSIEEVMKDGFLWSEPKSRRSKERRLTRRFGATYINKWATPRKDIISCLECGQYHEKGVICGNCYKKVQEETKAMMDAVGDKLKYDIPNSEVVYLYEGETDDRPKYRGKYIVEMEKPRPKWFSDALMRKVTSKP